jgi:hypothetical protein
VEWRRGFNQLSGRHGHSHKGQKKKNTATPTTKNQVNTATAVAEAKSEKTLCQVDYQNQERPFMPLRRFSKPDPFDVAIWGLILTAVIALIYYFQLRSMQETVGQLQTQTRLSVRPFVGPDEGADAIQNGTLHIDESGNVSMLYAVRAKNYSSAPAMNVFSFANLVVGDDLNTVYEQERNACTDAMIGKPDIGYLLFAGKDRASDGFPISTSVSIRHHDGQTYSFFVWLAGCIGYRDQFGFLYRTGFRYHMVDAVTGQPISWPGPPKGPIDVVGRFTQQNGKIDSGAIPKYKDTTNPN